MPRHPQSQRKRERGAVDMSPPIDSPPLWHPPPKEDCEESEPYTITPEDADAGRDRVKIRIVNHVATFEIVEFALVQQTYYRGKWRDVAMADSCHDDEIHVHLVRERHAGSRGAT